MGEELLARDADVVAAGLSLDDVLPAWGPELDELEHVFVGVTNGWPNLGFFFGVTKSASSSSQSGKMSILRKRGYVYGSTNLS